MNRRRRAKFAAEEALLRILADDWSSEEVSDIDDADDRESSDDFASERENVSNDDQ